jgi:hypothetical protein
MSQRTINLIFSNVEIVYLTQWCCVLTGELSGQNMETTESSSVSSVSHAEPGDSPEVLVAAANATAGGQAGGNLT